MPSIKSHLARISILACLMLLSTSLARAADGTWSNTSGGNWNTAGNWAGSIIADGADFTAFITTNINPAQTVTLDDSHTIGELEFSDGGSSSFAWTLDNSGGAILTLSNSGNAQIRANTATTITAPLSGGDNLILNNNASLILDGTNTYTGQTILRKGNLSIISDVADSTDGPFGNATSAVEVGDASTSGSDDLFLFIAADGVDFGRNTNVNNFGNRVVLGHNGSSAHDATWSGDLDLGRDIELAAHAATPNLTVSGIISGSGGITTIDNTGTVGTRVLTGNNTYTGTTTISEGVLTAGHNNAFGNTASTILLGDSGSATAAVQLHLQDGITLSRNVEVTTNGTGTATLGSAAGSTGNSEFSGNILLSRDASFNHLGSPTVTYSGIISGSGDLRVLGGLAGTSVITNTNTYTGDTSIEHGTLNIDAVVNTSTNGPLGNSANAVILGGTGGHTPTLNIDVTGTSSRAFTTDAGATGIATIGTTDTSDPTFSGTLSVSAGATELEPDLVGSVMTWSGNISGSGLLRKTGNGTLVLSGDNSGHSGLFALSDGLLQLASDNALGTGTFDFVNFGTTIEAVGAARTYSNAIDFGRPATLVGSNDLTFTGDAVMTAGSGNVDLINNGTGVFTFSGDISGSDGIDKSGSGDVVLSGNSSYTGDTDVLTGRLIVAGNNALGSTADGTFVTSGRTLAFQGDIDYSSAEPVSVTGIGHSSQGAINNISGDNSFAGDVATTGATTLGATAGTLHLTGDVLGGNALTITGSGTVALDGTVTASSVSVGSTAILGGSGTINTAISGSGMVDPGASPGILTATEFDPSGGLDASFELTQLAPDYTNALASSNDVMRLTDGTNPFTGSLGPTNEINVYFNLPSFVDQNGSYTGGFYTDRSTDFSTDIALASINYFARALGGSVNYQGNDYDPFFTAYPDAVIDLTTINPAGTQFGGQDGYVMQFTLSGLPQVPEPSSFLLLGMGILGITRHTRRRRRKA